METATPEQLAAIRAKADVIRCEQDVLVIVDAQTGRRYRIEELCDTAPEVRPAEVVLSGASLDEAKAEQARLGAEYDEVAAGVTKFVRCELERFVVCSHRDGAEE